MAIKQNTNTILDASQDPALQNMDPTQYGGGTTSTTRTGGNVTNITYVQRYITNIDSPYGAPGQIQYNTDGGFDGSTKLVFNEQTNTFTTMNIESSTLRVGELRTLSTANLGPVSNVKISGGTSGQFLRTDGTGNLVWSTLQGSEGTYVFNQSSAATTWTVNHNLGRQFVNVEVIRLDGVSLAGTYDYPTITFVDENTTRLEFTEATAGYAAFSGGAITFDPAGSNTQIQFNDSGTFGGSANFTFDKVTGELNVSGNITAPNFIGNIVGNIIGNIIVPGTTTEILYNTNGEANASPNLKFTGTALNVIGSVNANAITGNGAGLTAITGANVTGAVTLAATANAVAGANVTGTVANATAANTAITVTGAAQANITSVGTLTSLQVGTAPTSVAMSGGNLTATGDITASGKVATPSIESASDLAVAATGDVIMTVTGNVNFGGSAAINLADPVAAQDAATKSYVDSISQGLVPQEPAKLATTENLTGVTYDNGTAGVGATMTFATAVTTLDGVALTDGDRLLVKDQTTATWNGAYVRTSGTVWTRADNNNTPALMPQGSLFFVNGGTINAGTAWVQLDAIVDVGVTPVDFSQVASPVEYSAGTGIDISGRVISVATTGVTAGNHGSASQIPTFTVNEQGQLTAADSVTVGASGPAGRVQISDGTTFTSDTDLTFSGNTLSATNITSSVITSALFNGNGSGLTNINGANISGTVVAADHAITATTVTAANQPNITSTGILTGITATGIVDLNNTTQVDLGDSDNLHIGGGNVGYVLSTDGTGNLSWQSPAEISAAGTTGQIQFNSGVDTMAADGNLVWNNVTKTFSTGSADLAGNLTVGSRVNSTDQYVRNQSDNASLYWTAPTKNNYPFDMKGGTLFGDSVTDYKIGEWQAPYGVRMTFPLTYQKGSVYWRRNLSTTGDFEIEATIKSSKNGGGGIFIFWGTDKQIITLDDQYYPYKLHINYQNKSVEVGYTGDGVRFVDDAAADFFADSFKTVNILWEGSESMATVYINGQFITRAQLPSQNAFNGQNIGISGYNSTTTTNTHYIRQFVVRSGQARRYLISPNSTR